MNNEKLCQQPEKNAGEGYRNSVKERKNILEHTQVGLLQLISHLKGTVFIWKQLALLHTLKTMLNIKTWALPVPLKYWWSVEWREYTHGCEIPSFFVILWVWKDSKIPLKHSPSDRVPAAFLALSNLHSCCYNSRNIVYQSEQAWRFIDQSGSSSDLVSVCFPAPCTHRMLYALGVSQSSSDPLYVTQRYACWERIQNPSLGRVPLRDKQNWTRCGQKKNW